MFEFSTPSTLIRRNNIQKQPGAWQVDRFSSRYADRQINQRYSLRMHIDQGGKTKVLTLTD